jgi:hypothetical protein
MKPFPPPLDPRAERQFNQEFPQRLSREEFLLLRSLRDGTFQRAAQAMDSQEAKKDRV